MTLDQLLAQLLDPKSLTVGFIMSILVVGFWQEWLVSGKTYLKRCVDYESRLQKLEGERDEFKHMAMQSLEITERTQRVRGAALRTMVLDEPEK
jgi:hypothetical protein